MSTRTQSHTGLWPILVVAVAITCAYDAFLIQTFRTTTASLRYPGHVFVAPGDTRGAALRRAQESFAERLAPADGQFYLQISTQGYRGGGTCLAFFPLFPAMAALLGSIFGDALLWGHLLNCLSTVVGLVLLFRLAEICTVPGHLTLLLVAAYPASVFRSLFLTEAVHLLLSCSCVLLGSRRRYLAAALCGYLAGLTRPQGMLLVVPLAVMVFSDPDWLRGTPAPWRLLAQVLASAAPVLGMATFVGFGALVADDPLVVLRAQHAWGRVYGAAAVSHLLSPNPSGLATDVFALTFATAMTPLMFRRLPRPIALYGLALLILPLATGSLISYARFTSTSFPQLLCLAALLRDRPAAALGVLLMFLCWNVVISRAVLSWVVIA